MLSAWLASQFHTTCIKPDTQAVWDERKPIKTLQLQHGLGLADGLNHDAVEGRVSRAESMKPNQGGGRDTAIVDIYMLATCLF
jgi:hypothetical protein